MSELLEYFKGQQATMIDRLTTMVEFESFTGNKVMVDKLVDYVAQQFEELNADSVTRIPQEEVGDFLLAKWNENADGKPILFLVHIDTVHPIGTLADFPIRQEDGKYYGPGAFDMKAGFIIATEAIRGLQVLDKFPNRPIHFLITTEEEIGSPLSEPIIKQTAEGCEVALVLEPATPEGAIKTSRKGGGKYTLTVEGRASHAGVAPQLGINAIIEFAQQALEINKLNDLKNGTSVSVTVVNGGTAGNVIPAHVEAHIDCRYLSIEAMNSIHEALTNLYPKIPGAKVECVKGHSRPPMVEVPGLFEKVEAIGKKNGVTIYGGPSGGGSDGNFTAAMGIPTLDGLGAHGDGAHTLHEHIIINSLPRQATLIAGILTDWEKS